MRQLSWALVATAAIMSMGAPIAEAGVTCRMVASMCPAPDAQEHKGANAAVPTSSVPEPASLLLLGAGVTAVGAAMKRRRKGAKAE